jgi:Bacterial Ig-like domain (group 2)
MHGSRSESQPKRACPTLVVIALLSLAGCEPEVDSPTARTLGGVMSWLTCEECVDSERTFVVDSLGARAIPLLSETLLDYPDRYQENSAYELGRDWSLLSEPTLDSVAFIEHYSSNVRATAQARAAMALGDLDQPEVLLEALRLNQGDLIGLRPDVVRAIEVSLTPFGFVSPRPPGPPASLDIQPDAVAVTPGSSDFVGAVVKDTAGVRLLDVIVTWTSSDSNVATVAPDADQRGRVTGISPGAGEIRAEAGGVLFDTIAITVASRPQQRLLKTAGHQQTVRRRGVASDSLEVQVMSRAGPVRGVPVVFEVVVGDATIVESRAGSHTVPSNRFGRAFVYVRAGSRTGLIQVRARISSDSESFRLNVIN